MKRAKSHETILTKNTFQLLLLNSVSGLLTAAFTQKRVENEAVSTSGHMLALLFGETALRCHGDGASSPTSLRLVGFSECFVSTGPVNQSLLYDRPVYALVASPLQKPGAESGALISVLNRNQNPRLPT